MFDKYILFSNFPCVCSSFVSLVEVLCLFLCTLDCRGAMRQECYVGIFFLTPLSFTFGGVCIWKISGMLIFVFDMFFLLNIRLRTAAGMRHVGIYFWTLLNFTSGSFSVCVWRLQQGCGMSVMLASTKHFWILLLEMYVSGKYLEH